nr:hypothetical protein [Tanacetum cinerariifolium]
YEPEVQKKLESNSQNIAFISSSNTSSGKGEVHTASVPTASTQVSTASTDVAVASLSHDTSYMANEEENHALVADDEVPTKFALMAKSSSSSKNEVKARLVEFKEQEIKFCEKIRGLKRDVETCLPEFVDDTVTAYSRPTPSIDASKCNTSNLQSNNFFDSKHGESLGSIMSKPMIKFVKAADCPRVTKTNNTKNARKSTVKYAEGNSQNNIDDKGYWDSGCSRRKDYWTPRQYNMYSIDLNNIVPHKNLTCLAAKAAVDESMLWHRRLGHLNFKTMNKLVRNNLVKGLPSKCFKNNHTWVACMKGKQHKASCKTKLVNSVSKPRHTLHMDLFGPTYVSSLNHKWYCLVVTDDFSRCDNGGVFKNKEMNEFCTKKGIRREFSNARTPKQNGVAERRNRTLIEAARTMVLINKSQNKTPYELFNSRTPAIGFLKPFGCHVMILNTLDHLGKFDAKGVEDVSTLRHIALPNWFHDAHMETRNSVAPEGCNADDPESSGISNSTATLKVPSTKQVEPVVSLTVETEIPTVSLHVPTVCLDISSKISSDPRLISKGDFSQKETPFLGNALTLSNRFEDTFREEADLSNMETSIPVSPTPTFRIHKDHPKSQISGPVDTPVQTRHKSKEMKEQSFIATIHQKTNPDLLQFCLFSCFLSQEEPKKIFDALKDPSWVLKNKKDEKEIVIRNKAKLVAQGYTQEKGIDYEEVFTPVARIEAIRLFLAYASFMGFIVYQMDIKSAFLYGTIDEEVYVMQPPGFQDPDSPDRVYKVEKAMYGLHQAPRAWYGTLSKPDIMFDVCACARYQVTPKECHLHAVKRIFRYLKGHPKLGLWYPKESPFDLVAYSDSDYGGATQDRKSTTEGCQFLGRRLISWQCKKQTIVATSTTKAEYMAAASGCG